MKIKLYCCCVHYHHLLSIFARLYYMAETIVVEDVKASLFLKELLARIWQVVILKVGSLKVLLLEDDPRKEPCLVKVMVNINLDLEPNLISTSIVTRKAIFFMTVGCWKINSKEVTRKSKKLRSLLRLMLQKKRLKIMFYLLMISDLRVTRF